MTTSDNARVVEDELSEAACLLSDAIEKFKNAMAAVATAEIYPGTKLPELQSLQGLIEVGHRDTSRVISTWRAVRYARESEEARIKQIDARISAGQ